MTKVRVYETAKDTGARLAELEPLELHNDPCGTEWYVINVYDEVRYQQFLGFGGAFTEAAADTLYRLPPDLQEAVLDAYFDPSAGIGYRFCRTHMNSCDFSLGNYADVPQAGDVALESFRVDRERKALFPMIRRAYERAPITLFVSPWSPPAWMKSNGEMNHGGSLLPEYAGAWAQCFVRFIRALEQEGIPVWGMTVQNEPKAAQTWDSCVYTAEEEAAFAADWLAPALREAGLGHIKIMVWDHNKERAYERARAIFANPKAAGCVWGVGVHWYSGDHFEALNMIHERWPDKAIVFTEGCADRVNGYNSWQTAEAYAHDIIGDLNNHTAAWCDWNLLLDHAGGPNHVGNFCSAPIMASENYGGIVLQPSYWYIAHFSKFLTPGSVRVGCTRFGANLECTAFLRPDGLRALIVMNPTDREIPFVLRHNDLIAETQCAPRSIRTYLF